MYDTTRPLRKHPVHEIRCGNIKAAIWEIETPDGKSHEVMVTRCFKTGDRVHETPVFERNDLLVVSRLLDEAHSWILRESAKHS